MSNLSKAMEEKLSVQIDKLKNLPVDEIRNLPEYSDEEVTIRKKLCTLAIWKKITTDNMTQVVVQVYYRGYLGMGIMMADGFLVDSDRAFLTLPEETRLEYC